MRIFFCLFSVHQSQLSIQINYVEREKHGKCIIQKLHVYITWDITQGYNYVRK